MKIDIYIYGACNAVYNYPIALCGLNCVRIIALDFALIISVILYRDKIDDRFA